MIIAFETFETEVRESLKTWHTALIRKERSTQDVELLKEAANDLIDGWKAAFPNKRATITKKVDDYLVELFSS